MSDPDGITSFTILYRMMVALGMDMSRVTFHFHPKKEHGIIINELKDKRFDLLIVPDAGSNDLLEQEHFLSRGIDIIILDHHEIEESPTDLFSVIKRAMYIGGNIFSPSDDEGEIVVVNPQNCAYPNKALCGAAVVYKFCQSLDNHFGTNHAIQYIDLVALGLISDMMDSRELETRYLIKTGLENVKNKFFKAIIEKQSFSMKGLLNYFTVSFYVTPLINAMIRVGSQEEKADLVKAFINDSAQVLYGKAGAEKLVFLHEDMARQCSNAKSRQDRQKIKTVDAVKESASFAASESLPILIIESDDKDLKGLIANQLANSVMKPILMGRTDKNGTMSGSARGYEPSGITDFKEFCNGTGFFEFLGGHGNAFGFSITADNLEKFIEYIKVELKDLANETVYPVDFIFKDGQLSFEMCKELESLKTSYGQGFKEPSLAFEEIEPMEVFENEKVLSFKGKGGIKFTKFKPTEDEREIFRNGGFLVNVVGRAGVNEYAGEYSGQVIMQNYQIVKQVEKTFVF